MKDNLLKLIKKLDKNIVWLYDENHLNHPFIILGAESLKKEGYNVYVIDNAPKPGCVSYQHQTVLSKTCFYIGRYRIRGYGYLQWKLRLLKMFFATIFLRPSVIIATLPTAAFVGWIASSLLGAKLIYYPFELYGEQHPKVPTLWSHVELLLLRKGVDTVITQNEERAKIYLEERKSRVVPVIVHNYKSKRKSFPTGKLYELLKLPKDFKIVLYEGQLIQGRWLDKLVESTKYFPDKTVLVLMGYESPWWKKNKDILIAQSTKDKVFQAPWVPDSKLSDYIVDASVGVIIYDDAVRNNVYCEPGKLCDYLFAGVPVVAPDFPTISPVIQRFGIGYTFGNSEPLEIAGAINRVLDIPREKCKEALENAGEELQWETQKPNLLKAVASPKFRKVKH